MSRFNAFPFTSGPVRSAIRNRLLLTGSLVTSFGLYWLVDWIVQDVRMHYFITMEESLVDTSVILAAQVARKVQGSELKIAPFMKQAPSG